MSAVRAVSRAEGLALRGRADVLAVDSADCAPDDMARFRCFNPFHLQRQPLPVPGLPLHARSVEAIWQGLKLVDGRTDLAMFERKAEKRPDEAARRRPGYRYQDSRFRLGDRTIGLAEARRAIYVPSYLFLLRHLVPAAVDAELRAARAGGRELVFYDWDDNFDLDDLGAPYSHSALLAGWYGATTGENHR